MPIFHASEGRGRIPNLVLHDGKEEWARAENGVLKLSDAVAKRFREVAHLYGYTEQNPPQPVKAPVPAPPAAPAAPVTK